MIDPAAESTMGDAQVLAAVRAWTPARRLESACRLTAMVRASSRNAWRRRHPGLTARDADIAWAEAQYGRDIGAALRVWAARQA